MNEGYGEIIKPLGASDSKTVHIHLQAFQWSHPDLGKILVAAQIKKVRVTHVLRVTIAIKAPNAAQSSFPKAEQRKKSALLPAWITVTLLSYIHVCLPSTSFEKNEAARKAKHW